MLYNVLIKLEILQKHRTHLTNDCAFLKKRLQQSYIANSPTS